MKEAPRIIGSDKREDQPGYYLTGQVIAAYSSRERFQTVPTKDLGGPVNGISKTQVASTCLRVVPPCGTKAGAFLTSLKKPLFNNLPNILNDSSTLI